MTTKRFDTLCASNLSATAISAASLSGTDGGNIDLYGALQAVGATPGTHIAMDLPDVTMWRVSYGGDYVLQYVGGQGWFTKTSIKQKSETDYLSTPCVSANTFSGGNFYGTTLSATNISATTISATTISAATLCAGGLIHVPSATSVLHIRPQLDQAFPAVAGKPTKVVRGVSHGYSLPLSALDEVLYFNDFVPGRWDGTTNPEIHLIGYLNSAEDVGDSFNLAVYWNTKHPDSGTWPLSSAVASALATIETDREAQFSMYEVRVAIAGSAASPVAMAHGDYLAMQACRIAVPGEETEIDGEFVVTDAVMHYNVDKVFNTDL